MISRLKGILIEKQPPYLLIEVADAFTYEVQASMHTFYQLPELGQPVLLYTQFIVREDGHYLYGFSAIQERALFSQLLKVNGVGPKVALGIGKKTAERLIVEMRDRLQGLSGMALVNRRDGNPNDLIANYQQDAISALMALGYKNQEASRAVLQVKDNTLSLESLIRQALKSVD